MNETNLMMNLWRLIVLLEERNLLMNCRILLIFQELLLDTPMCIQLMRLTKKEDTIDDDYDSETNPLMKIDLFDESKGPETELEDDVDNDPKVDLFFTHPFNARKNNLPSHPPEKDP